MQTRRQWFQKLAIGCAAASLAGCSQPKAALDPGLRAWNRAAFGPRPGDLEGFRLEAFVEEQLHPAEIDDAVCERRLAEAELSTLDLSLEQLWKGYYLPSEEAESQDDWEQAGRPYSETVQATWLRAVYSRRQLHEVLVDFWHNHFNVYGLHDDVYSLLAAYDRDAIRAHTLGNFSEMLLGVARHPVMLLYLDNGSNEVSGPNENYARELLELHTLGAMHYAGASSPRTGFFVDNDVYEVARCFTGWGVDDGDDDDTLGGSGRFRYRLERHDRFNKLVLGEWLRSDQDGMVEGEAVLRRLAEHPSTARHLAFKLCRRFVSDDPPAALVEKAADVFWKARHANDQLRQVVGFILRSPEFLAAESFKLKRPFEFAASLARALAVDFEPDEEFLESFEAIGQPLFGRVTPDGYPDRAEAWLQTSGWLARWQLVEGWLAGVPTRGPLELEKWSRRLLGRPCTHPEVLAGCRNPRELVGLLAMGPDFQIR